MKVFAIDYQLDGKRYSAYIEAPSFEEAERRAWALKWHSGVTGEIVKSIAMPKWLSNLF